jgi:hypothetical protein
MPQGSELCYGSLRFLAIIRPCRRRCQPERWQTLDLKSTSKTNSLPPDLRDRFRSSGLYHLLSVDKLS